MNKESTSLFSFAFKKDIFFTIITQLLNTAVFAVMLLFVLPHYITKSELGTYILFRSFVLVLLPLFTCGIDLAQARYLGYFTNDTKKQQVITASVLLLFVVVLIFATSVFLFFKPFITEHFFENNGSIFYALLTALISTSIFRIVYTYYQGKREIFFANTIHILIIFCGYTVASFLIVFGILNNLTKILWFVAVIPLFSLIPFIAITIKTSFKTLEFSTIIHYSFPRVPYVILNGFLMSSAIILIKYFHGGSVVGDIAISSRFFQFIEIIAYAFNVVLLPNIAYFWYEKQLQSLSASINRYLNQLFFTGTSLMFIFFVFAPIVINFFLPLQYNGAVLYIKVMSLSVIPYMLYSMVQHVINAVDKRPILLFIDIGRLIFLLLPFFVIFSTFPDYPGYAVSISFVISFWIGGVMSYYYLLNKLNITSRNNLLLLHLLFVILLMVVSMFSNILSIVFFVVVESFFVWKQFDLKETLNLKIFRN